MRALTCGVSPSVDEVVLLDEDLPQPALAAGVVLEVEAVEAVEHVLVGVHVKHVHVQHVACDTEREIAQQGVVVSERHN